MQIVVCAAITPSTDTRVKIASDGQSMDLSEAKFEIGPYDEFALEEAIRIKEAAGEGEVIVVTVGDEKKKEELKKCLARGGDRAVLLKTDASDCDSAQIADLLTAWLQDQDAQIVFFGKQTVDGGNSQVPNLVACALDMPAVTKISSLTFDGDSFTAEREIEGAIEVIRGSLPAVFSAEKGLNDPRYPSLKGIMAAKRKPMDEIDVTPGERRVSVTGLSLPPERPAGRIIGEGVAAVSELTDLLKNEAKVL